jgi:hypothetical protein
MKHEPKWGRLIKKTRGEKTRATVPLNVPLPTPVTGPGQHKLQ